MADAIHNEVTCHKGKEVVDNRSPQNYPSLPHKVWKYLQVQQKQSSLAKIIGQMNRDES